MVINYGPGPQYTSSQSRSHHTTYLSIPHKSQYTKLDILFLLSPLTSCTRILFIYELDHFETLLPQNILRQFWKCSEMFNGPLILVPKNSFK